ncbi:hypothetical protein [Cupriavidus necator]
MEFDEGRKQKEAIPRTINQKIILVSAALRQRGPEAGSSCSCGSLKVSLRHYQEDINSPYVL